MKSTLTIVKIAFIAICFAFTAKTSTAQIIIPGANSGIIEGFKTSFQVKEPDTAKYQLMYDLEASFSSPTKVGPVFEITGDSLIKLTATVAGDSLPPAGENGYTIYLVLMRYTSVDTIDFILPATKVWPTPKPVTIENLTVKNDILSFFGNSGSVYDTCHCPIRIKYGIDTVSDVVWRTISPEKVSFVGKKLVSQELRSILTNRDIALKMECSNSNSSFDTIIFYKSGIEIAKPLQEVKSVEVFSDSAKVIRDVNSFNIPTASFGTIAQDTTILDTIVIYGIQDTKTVENVMMFYGLLPETTYTLYLWVESGTGKSKVETIIFTTSPRLVGPKITAMDPHINVDRDGLYILPKFEFLTSMNKLFKRVDLLIVKNDTLGIPSIQMVSGPLGQMSGFFTGPRIDLPDTGKYWYRFLGEIENEIVQSSWLEFRVSPENLSTNVKMIDTPSEFEGICQLYDISGKKLARMVVKKSTNLFDPSIPRGVIICIPIENFKPFKAFNNQ